VQNKRLNKRKYAQQSEFIILLTTNVQDAQLHMFHIHSSVQSKTEN